jgi:tripartite-type tricarboxylate transporter receptor subunit TctC
MMTFSRRQLLHLAAAAAVLTGSRRARAQAYPSRPICLIVGFPAGGPTDITARLIAQWLSERLGQQIVIENRAGAGSNIAVEATIGAPPDGYTLLIVGATNAINATLYEKLNFNFIRDIAPVAGIIRVPLIMEVHPSVSAKTVAEFIAYAKARPGKINMGSGGIGTTLHVSGELFKMMTGRRHAARAVPWRRADAHGSSWRTGAGGFRPDAVLHRLRQSRPIAPAGGDDRNAVGSASGASDRRRFRSGLRGEHLVRRRCAEEHAR